jgi:hypothetical protein
VGKLDLGNDLVFFDLKQTTTEREDGKERLRKDGECPFSADDAFTGGQDGDDGFGDVAYSL